MATRVRTGGMDFVKAYMEVYKAGGTYADVAERLGLKRDTVAVKVSQWRNKTRIVDGKEVACGVNLPPLGGGKRGAKPLDEAELNAFIAQAVAEGATATE